jgi:hypothetical protein
MTQNEILKIAAEAGAFWELSETPEKDVAFLMRFAERAAVAEREACAQLCESYGPARVLSGEDCAAAIRARGEK